MLLIITFLQVFIWKTIFTELDGDAKENIEQNPVSTPTSQTSKVSAVKKGRPQVIKKR